MIAEYSDFESSSLFEYQSSNYSPSKDENFLFTKESSIEIEHEKYTTQPKKMLSIECQCEEASSSQSLFGMTHERSQPNRKRRCSFDDTEHSIVRESQATLSHDEVITPTDSSRQPQSNTSAVTDQDEEIPKKRTRNSQLWKKNLKKQDALSGIDKKMGPPCKCVVKRCRLKLTEDERKSNFDEFYKLRSHSEQWLYLSTLIEDKPVKLQKVFSNKNKNFSPNYHLKKMDGSLKAVCKEMFKSTLNVCDSTIVTARDKARGRNPSDQRGGSEVTPLLEKKREIMLQQIKELDKMEAHYVRKTDKKLYLNAGLDVEKVYEAYKEWFSTRNYEEKFLADRHQYRRYFSTFNLGFHKWKKDRCSTCVQKEQGSLPPDFDHQNHLANARFARVRKEHDKAVCQAKTNRDIYGAAFDLQKILVCPVCNNSLAYYRGGYHCYNFTIYDYKRSTGYNYFWEERHGGKGNNPETWYLLFFILNLSLFSGYREIIGCLMKYIAEIASEGAKEVRFYSDNAFSQNKSRFLISFYLWAAKRYGITIKHLYLVRGHTENEADSVHSMIEKRKGDSEVFIPEEYCYIIRTAKKNNPKYKLYKMEASDFKSTDHLATSGNFKGIPISKISEMEINKDAPTILKYKINYEIEWKEANIQTKKFEQVIKTDLPNAYEGKRTLKVTTVNNIRYLIDKKVFPPSTIDFYEKVLREHS